VIERSIMVRCDVCLVSSDIEDAACVTEVMLRRDLKERGWVFERESRLHEKCDRCPVCAKGGK
jgi:hypothetical protein